MPFDATYHEEAPTREEVDASQGLMLLEFGANWCGICQGLSPAVQELLDNYPQVRHVRVADGRGKKLGRSFAVKLWPTFVFLRNGQTTARLVRPEPEEIRRSLEELTGS